MFLVKFVNCVSERQQASKMCRDNVRIKFRLYKMLDFTLESLSSYKIIMFFSGVVYFSS